MDHIGQFRESTVGVVGGDVFVAVQPCGAVQFSLVKESLMADISQMASDEERKAVALEYFKRLDRGEDFSDLFDARAQLYFPKWGLANGIEEIMAAFVAVGSTLASVTHDYAYFNYVQAGDVVVVEGTSSGRTAQGDAWRAGVTHAGRWCDVFEIRGSKIHRLYVYLDPDYGDQDVERYPWLNHTPEAPA